MFVLRLRKDGRILGMSYTEDGLRWVTNKVGKCIYYKNARLKQVNGQTILWGDTSPNPMVIVERYRYKKHEDKRIQYYEDYWRKVYYQKLYTTAFPEEIPLIDRWLNTKHHA